MSELIVAHRYAKSLLDFAIEKNVVDAVYTDMVGFKETCEGSKDLVLALKSPIIKHYTKLAILNKLFKYLCSVTRFAQRAEAPEIISTNSMVILACLALLY